MRKNELLKRGNGIIRVLDIQTEKVFVIDCIKRTMPAWIEKTELEGYSSCCTQELYDITDMVLYDTELLDAKSRQTTRQRFTMIAGLLPIVGDAKLRNLFHGRAVLTACVV